MSEWHYVADGKSVGPLSLTEINQLFLDNKITLDTLVWSKEMDQWSALKEVKAFKHLLPSKTPPPLPPKPAAAPSIIPTVPSASETEEHLESDEDIASPEDRERVARLIEESERDLFEMAGPWSRYFARSLDLSILTSVIFFVAMVLLPYIDPRWYFSVFYADLRVTFICLLPFGHILNAVILKLFGNSIAKSLFGIKAVPLRHLHEFDFKDHLKREFRVWVRGLAFGIPIVNLYTMGAAYDEVKKKKLAPYDVGIATVKSYSHSVPRRSFAMLLSGIVFIAIASSNAIYEEAIQTSLRWTNPETSVAISIPRGWQYEPVAGADGGTIHGFTDLTTGVVALFASERLENTDLQSYADALETSLSNIIALEGDWVRADLPDVWRINGRVINGNNPATIHLTKLPSDVYWRIIYIDPNRTSGGEVSEPGMTTSLFRSIGVTSNN
jgi:hypothetical protein